MKKTDFYTLNEEGTKIHFVESGNEVEIKAMKKVEVLIKPVLKGAVATVLNATVNAMTSSIANGNEKINIVVRVVCEDGNEDILMTKTPLVRNNLDYHEMIEHARKLQKALKEYIK